MKNKIMSEEAFNELIENIEVVSQLTMYGRKNIKYYVNKLQKENLQLKDTINKAKEYCDFGIKEWITDDGFVEEVLKDVLKILDKKGNDK